MHCRRQADDWTGNPPTARPQAFRYLEFPVMEHQPESGHEPRAARRRVLVVDDDLDFVHSMAMLLRAKGHEVSFAINATVALSVARSFRPDTVLLDIKLPNGDGRML